MTEVSFMEHAQPVCVANSEGAQTMTAYTVGEAERNSVVAEIRALVGADVVLLPIPIGEKGPRTKAWQQTMLDRMADPDYLQELESAGNIGVLLGKPSTGLCAIDIDADENAINRGFNADLTHTARVANQKSIFLKRTNAMICGLVALLKAQSERSGCFESRPAAIHVKNGMVCIEDGEVSLKSFHPDFLSRNQCPYALDPDADCPRFKAELLGTALDDGDIQLLQKWAGAVLLGRNSAQRLLLVMGTPGGGKSTLMTIIERIVGMENIAQLRTQHLGDRFELFGCIGKTLLSGKDVAADFLMQKGSHVLKALVGGDSLEAEKKGGNERIGIRGDFNVGITCNADLNIRLEGDEGAWRRRLLIIKYERPAPTRKISDFADRLLAEEGNGILRWMIDGAVSLQEDLSECGDYKLTDAQKARIDNVMSQSESLQRFVEEGVCRRAGRSIGITALKGAYYSYCERRHWTPLPDKQISSGLQRLMPEVHRVGYSHDLVTMDGSAKGFRNVTLVEEEDQADAA